MKATSYGTGVQCHMSHCVRVHSMVWLRFAVLFKIMHKRNRVRTDKSETYEVCIQPYRPFVLVSRMYLKLYMSQRWLSTAEAYNKENKRVDAGCIDINSNIEFHQSSARCSKAIDRRLIHNVERFLFACPIILPRTFE
ncbi:hypothetical protein PAXRUDRAFT_655604 [Paxillus rubicundulus Ve08.2h10]|uniref:Uncharacterized protein n=1 Tax=Paxillus rubicundulus Ve08.2h10 TaxID=930991 RepID=A0A0D0D3E8_9AGAM|nr:hypothetical protein PAXRUDRAFT_655604 [Paxillus rubicundulus Ve08.2h10]